MGEWGLEIRALRVSCHLIIFKSRDWVQGSGFEIVVRRKKSEAPHIYRGYTRSLFPSFPWKEVPRRGGGWLAPLSIGQPLALRAFPFQRKGIDKAKFESRDKWLGTRDRVQKGAKGLMRREIIMKRHK